MSNYSLKGGWCFECKRTVLREEMVFASANRHRKVCPDCFERIRQGRIDAREKKIEEGARA